jgi:hypothetical protein
VAAASTSAAPAPKVLFGGGLDWGKMIGKS